MNTAAERFGSVRLMLHLNKGQFADFLGITGGLVGGMEKGTMPISRKTVSRMTDRLGVNPVWLQYGQGEMFVRSDITLETILADNPVLKAVYDFRAEKEKAQQQKVEDRLERAAARIARRREAAERMKAFRAHVQINQSQLAARLGVSRELVSSIEREQKMISVPMAEQIQREFGVSAAWLLEGKGEMLLPGEPVQMRLDGLVGEENGYRMLAEMVCALTDRLKAGDWETLNAVYGELVGSPETVIEENPRCELIAV